jgi:hypothetical protein
MQRSLFFERAWMSRVLFAFLIPRLKPGVNQIKLFQSIAPAFRLVKTIFKQIPALAINSFFNIHIAAHAAGALF